VVGRLYVALGRLYVAALGRLYVGVLGRLYVALGRLYDAFGWA
jgi:hypothetical protein